MKNKYAYSTILVITLIVLSIISYLSFVDIIKTQYVPIACLVSLCILNIAKYFNLKNSTKEDVVKMKRCKDGALIYGVGTLIFIIIIYIF